MNPVVLDQIVRQQEEIERLTAERDAAIDWVCHNGGLLNEWAKDWNPAKHPPLTDFIRERLITALGELK